MNLEQNIKTYVRRRRANGVAFDKGEANLISFAKQVGDVPLHSITTYDVSKYLDGPFTSTVTWRGKHSLLRQFFEFWVSRGFPVVPVMPPARAPVRQTFTPYIYTRADIRSLIKATRIIQGRNLGHMEAHTMKAILIVLYATGALLGQVLQLTRGDVYVGSSAAPIPQVQTFHPASPSPVQPSSVVVGGLIFSAAQSEPSIESNTASDQPEAEPVVVGGKEYAPIAPTSQSETSQVAGKTPEQGGSESLNPQEQSNNQVHSDHTEPDDSIPQPAQADSTPIVIGGITYTPVSSNPTSLPQSAAVFSLAPTASLLAIGSQTLTALPGSEVGFEIDHSTLLPGGSAISINGKLYSINGADSLIVGTSTIPLATVGSSNMSDGALTAGGETFTPLGSTAVVVDGSTISVGGSAITVNGTRLSLASNGLLVGSSTFAYATPVVNTTTVSTASSSTFSTGISPGSGVISTTFPSATGGPGRSGASAKVITRRGLAIWVGMSMSLSMVTGLL